jgi:hypothetical protein
MVEINDQEISVPNSIKGNYMKIHPFSFEILTPPLFYIHQYCIMVEVDIKKEELKPRMEGMNRSQLVVKP